MAMSSLTVPSPVFKMQWKKESMAMSSLTVPSPVFNAMEEGVKHGNELVDSAKPRVQNAMEEGVKHGNELVDSAKPMFKMPWKKE